MTDALKKKVLVIDDNAGILFVVQQALELKQYEVHTSENYPGIRLMEDISPDLICLDVSLVGQDGRDIARELKSDPRTKHIPIILLTAYPNAADMARESGANDALSKPFELTLLWEMAAKYTSPAVGV
jgi:two-component system alkaline phosphatase synthesis response regulator PhoP